jgi:hypothetical protein
VGSGFLDLIAICKSAALHAHLVEIMSFRVCVLVLSLFLVAQAVVILDTRLPENNVTSDVVISSNSVFPGYNPEDAKTYVYYSFSAYSDATQLQGWNCYFCIGNTAGFQTAKVSYDGTTDTQVFVGYHPDRNEGKVLLEM